MNPLLFGVGSFALCFVAYQIALRLFPTIGLTDFPERYGHQRAPIPYPTGIIAVLCFLVFGFFVSDPTKQNLGLGLGIITLGLMCFVDDRKQLRATTRILLQILVFVLIFGTGTRIYTITNPLLPDGILKLDTVVFTFPLFDNPPLWSGVFTIVWLGLTTNALNWFDGIPGQVSVLSTIGFFTIGFLSLSARVQHLDPAAQAHLATLAFVLGGVALAGLWFDFPPAKVLMGDTGAMFFGLMLGVLTIYSGGKVATAFLVLGVPLIDSGFVVMRRLRKGVSIWRGNATDEHLHHRLLTKGWSQRQVIALTAGLGLSFGVSALFLSTQGKLIAAVILTGIMLLLSLYSSPRHD